jgi:hypothetical protein
VYTPVGGSYLVQCQDQQDSCQTAGAFSLGPYSDPAGKQAVSLQDRGNTDALRWSQPPIIHQPSVQHQSNNIFAPSVSHFYDW